MDIKIKLTYDLPANLINALGIDEFTEFRAAFENGMLVVETVSAENIADDDYEEGYDEGISDGLKEGYAEGFKYGYKNGYEDRDKQLPYDDTVPETDECPYTDKFCDECPFYCPQCKECHRAITLSVKKEAEEQNA